MFDWKVVFLVVLLIAIIIDSTLASLEAAKDPKCDLPGFKGARAFFGAVIFPLAILTAAMMMMPSLSMRQNFTRYRW